MPVNPKAIQLIIFNRWQYITINKLLAIINRSISLRFSTCKFEKSEYVLSLRAYEYSLHTTRMPPTRIASLHKTFQHLLN